MGNNKLPFYKVILGVICGMLSLGAALSIVMMIFYPESLAGNFFTSLLLFFGFGYSCLTCFRKKNNTESIPDTRLSKYKVYKWLLRIAVFIVAIAITTTISVLIDLPSSPTPLDKTPHVSSTLSTIVSFCRIIISALLAYYIPIPKKWMDEPNQSNSPKLTSKDDAILSSDVSASADDEVVYEREDVEL